MTDDFLTLYGEIYKYGQDQLLKYIEVLEKLSRAYRHTHNQLKKLCESHEYTSLYGHYDKEVKRIREWIKAATARETELMAGKEREDKEEKAEKARRREEKERKEREEKEEKVKKEREEKEGKSSRESRKGSKVGRERKEGG